MGDSVQIFDVLELLVQCCELVEMRGEQTKCVDLGGDLSVRNGCKQNSFVMDVDILRYGPSQPESVIGGRS
jgi:hypothetical protein